MILIPGVHDEAIKALKEFSEKQGQIKWQHDGPGAYIGYFGGQYYRLEKDGRKGAWFLYKEDKDSNSLISYEIVRPYAQGSGTGFFEDGFGRTLIQAKFNVRNWLQRGVTCNDSEWEV